MDTRVILTKQAFQGLFASAYETFRFESGGFLSGKNIEKRFRQDFMVELAQASQTAKRTYDSVESAEKDDARLKFILNCIGGFHSHFNASSLFSDEDLDALREDHPKGIEILVALEKTRALKKLSVSPCRISGCFADKRKKYRMTFRAYYLDFGGNGGVGRKRRAEIIIPRRLLKQYF